MRKTRDIHVNAEYKVHKHSSTSEDFEQCEQWSTLTCIVDQGAAQPAASPCKSYCLLVWLCCDPPYHGKYLRARALRSWPPSVMCPGHFDNNHNPHAATTLHRSSCLPTFLDIRLWMRATAGKCNADGTCVRRSSRKECNKNKKMMEQLTH